MKPFITMDDTYLVLNPENFSYYSIIASIIALTILIIVYKSAILNTSKLKFLVLSIFILVNITFSAYFIENTPKEISRFWDKNYNESANIIGDSSLLKITKIIKEDKNKNLKYYLSNYDDPFYLNVKAKFKLAYYLLPSVITYDIKSADYIIIANFEHKKQVNLEIPENKDIIIYKISQELALIKIMPKKEG